MNTNQSIPSLLARRAFLSRSATGLGAMALASLLKPDLFAAAAPANDAATGGTLGRPHFAPTAKRVIFLFMAGGPSHVDLFDPKPKLTEMDGKPLPQSLLKNHQKDQPFALIRGTPNLMRSPYRFRPCGKSGTVLSELLPHLGGVADELAVIRSMHTESNVHDPAVNYMNCGTLLFDRPTLGSWLSYGLGSENQNLPAYVVLTSGSDDGQPLLQSFWGNGFLDSRHAGVPLRNTGSPVLYLSNPPGITAADRRRELDLIQWMNRRQHAALGDPEIASRIASYEMAFRMQASVPDLADVKGEPDHVLKLYGAEPGKASFARNCLLARRLIERGVRFVQLYDRGWDSHKHLDAEHRRQCKAADQPIAALITDLKRRGLLEDTLILWGGEFGRTPVAQINGRTVGRDHHPFGFTMWMAGGGARPGVTYGSTDEFGYHAVENPVHVNDLHATVLRLLGIDHEKLIFRTQGRDFRLTDVAGKVIADLMA